MRPVKSSDGDWHPARAVLSFPVVLLSHASVEVDAATHLSRS